MPSCVQLHVDWIRTRLPVHIFGVGCLPQAYPFLHLIYLQYRDTIQTICDSCREPALPHPPQSPSLFDNLKNEISYQCHKALYFASLTLCAGASIIQTSTTTAPKLFGCMTIMTSINATCHSVVVSRFMRLMRSDSGSPMYHWSVDDIHMAAIIVAIPEAFTLGCIVSTGICIAMYLAQPGAPQLQLTSNSNGLASINNTGAQPSENPSINTLALDPLPRWAMTLVACLIILTVIQFAGVLHLLKQLCRTGIESEKDKDCKNGV
ncbi:hypothetical protein BC629DRAFT_1530872 [Irpex lacteus]|nr:hypothetical protein BC629DRAFT_1530872 [Irpex lacteus]